MHPSEYSLHQAERNAGVFDSEEDFIRDREEDEDEEEDTDEEDEEENKERN